MNWGKGIALTLVVFVGMMAYFLVRAAQNPEPLVTEHYYEQELTFQDRIDATQRAMALPERVRIQAERDHISIHFPAQVAGSTVQGELALIRTNDPTADRTVRMTNVPAGHFERTIQLLPGRYMAQLEWQAGETTYYTEEQLSVQ